MELIADSIFVEIVEARIPVEEAWPIEDTSLYYNQMDRELKIILFSNHFGIIL